MSKQSSPILLIGSLVCLIVYLVTPVLRIAFVIGVNGIQAIQWLSAWFILPVIALVLCAIVAVVGGKSAILGTGGAVALLWIVFLIAFKGIAGGGNIGLLSSQLGQQVGDTLGNASYGAMATNWATQLLLNPAWGFFLSAGLFLVAFVLQFILGGQETSRAAVPTATSARHSRYSDLYRK